MRWVGACAWLLGVSGCAPDAGHTLFVDLRTDYLASSEVATVDVDLLRGGDEIVTHRELALLAGADLLGGLRVGELEAVTAGDYQVRVRLRERSGALRASRRVAVTISGDVVITVVITRSCEGVECPGASDPATATECVDRQCVEPGCEQTGGSCGTRCAGDADCPAAGCGHGACVEGTCFVVPDDGLCEMGATCDLALGCVSDGPGDAGLDAGFDAGFDAGTDAGPPPPACPANGHDCSSGERTGWSRDASWSCRADGALGRARGTLTCRVCNTGGCRDCTYDDVTVECACRLNVCASGYCNDVINGSSRCDDGSEFSCREITDRYCEAR